MDQPPLALLNAPDQGNSAASARPAPRRLSANGKPIGRPPGKGNKRSTDLARYIEATFGGTPGQQAAQLALVTPAEVKRAKDDARDLRLIDHGLRGLELAMVVKAAKLALALGCERRDAWLLLQKERADLMPYVHQRQAQKPASDPNAAPTATVFIMGDAEAQDLAHHNAAVDLVEDFSRPDDEVAR
jgi:hypothetical protein